jgi:hypothetical protein
LPKGLPISLVAAISGNSPRIVEKQYAQWIASRQEAINASIKAKS